MLYRMRNEYLKSVGKGPQGEMDVVRGVLSAKSEMESKSTPYLTLWNQILKYFHPQLNSIYNRGQGGNIVGNDIWTAKPTSMVMELVYFYFISLFPTNLWLNHKVTTPGGKRIPHGKLSPVFLRHLDDLHSVVINLLEKGGFFLQTLPNIAHHLLLGNSVMRVRQRMDGGLVYNDIPVHIVQIKRDSCGDIYGFSWTETVARDELIRDYGPGVMELFKAGTNMPASPPGELKTWSGRESFGGSSLASSNPTNTFGVEDFATQSRTTEQLVYLHFPNAPYSLIEGGGKIYPEMKNVTYVVALRTKRLVDVWFSSGPMFGASSDTRIMGEHYARGLCGRLLPDVWTLNEKAKIKLQGEGVTLQTPIVFQGQAPRRKLKKMLPWEKIEVDAETKVYPLFPQAANRQNRQREGERDEYSHLRESMHINKINVELADRMTAYEYRMRLDGSRSLFHPQGLQLYEGLKPVIQYTVDFAYLTGLIEPPPIEMITSGLNFEIELQSVFSFGAKEMGANLTRAIAPFEGIMEKRPDLWNWVNMGEVLKDNLSQYNVAHYINDPKTYERLRQAQMEMEAGVKAATGMEDPVQAGFDKAEEEVAKSKGMAQGGATVPTLKGR